MLGDAELTVTNVDVQELSCFSSKTDPSNFQLIRILGQGSFGKVFLVRKRLGMDAGKLFAMKVLRKASLKLRDRIRTKMERDILAAIRHPFIVHLEYAFQTEGKLYLILEYLRGGDLFTRLSREIMLPEKDVQFYLAELALALNHLHHLGIIYRDLKPENILLDVEGHIKLTDFGLSKEAIHHGSGGQAFSFCGTIEYMAPEVITRRGHDSAADWWSLGVLMFEMLCGALPFQGENRRDTMGQILRAKLRMPQFLSPDAQTLLRALFKRNPSNRLGYGPNGFEQLQAQPFFSSISWSGLLDGTFSAPYRPICSPHQADVALDSVSSSPSLKESPDAPASASAWEIFRGFSYTAPKVMDQSLDHFPESKEEDPHLQAAVFTRSPTPAASTTPFHDDTFGSYGTNQNARTSDSVHSGVEAESHSSIETCPRFTRPLDTGTRRAESSLRLDVTGSSGSVALSNVKTTPFSDDFELKEILGRGAHATCQRCVHRRTFEVYAVKIIDKRVHDPTDEISILTRFSHLKHIVTLYAVYNSDPFVYIVTEYLGGGELLDRVMRKHGLSEFEASRVTEVIASTLVELHRNRVVHRDITPSNLVYAALNQDPSSLRICDFGFSKTLPPDNGLLMTPRYTIPYAAPEVLRQEGHSFACDLWSLGVLLCVLLVGRTPFTHRPVDSPMSLLNRIQSEGLKLLGPKWYRVSVNAKDLVSKLLEVDPEKRITANDVLLHPWVTNKEELPRQRYTINSNEEMISKPAINTWYKVSAPIPATVPALGPVTDSQLAARRQQSRMKSKPKTLTIRPPKLDPVQTTNSAVTCTSSFILKQTKWPSDMAIFPHSLPNSGLMRSTNCGTSPHATIHTVMTGVNGHTDGGACFFTSATFTLSHPVRSKPFYSPGHGSLHNQTRVVV
ncbi:Ribosomal protein S6 kinase alpha-1 [Fasciolopsis buskii]|uniref:non-specific serine/threonine protein kinase n=1 Tax=Fasciolopsis buskii TaxID=27845 RepID=A0A8E0S1G4_9TREM|nr:Ribosomal protein S6 kinase alpha-1 [Fasciolopsis buski]